MDFLGRVRNCHQSFSRFKLEATLEGETLKISSRKKKRKESFGSLPHLEVSVRL